MKQKKHHIGEKIKRLRSFKGMTQEELAQSIGKTRSLISYFETTGNINKYTLQEISSVLGTSLNELESLDISVTTLEENDPTKHTTIIWEKLIEQQKEEIEFLKRTIHTQWNLLNELTKGKK